MNRPSGDYRTVTIQRSFPAATADGATALVLETDQLGTIAFVVTPEVIEILRNDLNRIEAMQFHGTGNA